MKQKNLVLSVFAAIVLAACDDQGNSSSTTSSTSNSTTTSATPVQSQTPSGGLYIGYYYENPVTNPEDPTSGSLFLNLPNGNAQFLGAMRFTYIGCQTASTGTISGDKTDLDLHGQWTGSIDNSPQSGKYDGQYDSVNGFYSGTYTNNGGKQFRDLRPCISYYIAPDGTWELFPLSTTISSDKTPKGVSYDRNTNTITWYPPTDTQSSFVSVVDQDNAQSTHTTDNANAVVWQSNTVNTTVSVPVTLTVNRKYIVFVKSSNSVKRNYVSSQPFTY